MADNPLVVALLKEYKDEASVTRTEVGKMIGKTRGAIAGICRRNKIKPWPKIPNLVIKNRSCQFPNGIPGHPDFNLCGARKDVGHSFLCATHRKVTWKPECQMLTLKK